MAKYDKQPSQAIDTSVKGIARRISLQDDEADKMELINKYMERVKKDLLDSIGLFDKGTTSPAGSLSDTMKDAQSVHSPKGFSDKEIDDIENFCQELNSKGKDKI